MEKRRFGKTGLETTILGFGGFHILEITAAEAEYLLNRYLDAGGNYIETAASYGNGESELKIGKAVSGRRNECVLVTKSSEREKEGFVKSVETSLRNLKTEYIDIVLMHGVGTEREVDSILGPSGAMEGFLKLKEQGKVGFVGLSMHGRGDSLIYALNKYPFDAVMTTINYYDRFNFPEVEDVLLPLASEKDTAVILMKPLADGLLWSSYKQAFKYAMTKSVSVVVTGINNRKMLENDLNIAENFSPMSESEIEELFFTATELGSYVCRQCGKCMPCPQGVPIQEIFLYEGYYDRQMRNGEVVNAAEFALRDRLRFWFGNQELAREKYDLLKTKADGCNQCGVCIPKCPYGIDIINKLKLADYKLAVKNIY
jgi:uncharacterized protein